jgi:hypothetical protein
MFLSLFQDHLQGSSLALSAYHTSAARFVICLYWYVVVCPLFVFVCGCMPSVCIFIQCSCLCVVWFVHDQTTHRQVHWIQIQTEDIRPHTSTETF